MEVDFPDLEKKILKYWQQNRIFEKSIIRRKKAPNFVFYEGPPTANARPGIHHVLSRVFKDIICRYKTMRGFKVLRKAGWDTHGLPVELEIEKKLGLKNKKDIEKYGIAKFNKKCKESVWNYKKDWEKLTERIGFWLDLENPYITYTPDYIETVWWIIAEIWRKGLLYQDYKVVPYCPRCGTSLSSHEVAQGYERIKEPAIFVKFKILDLKFQNTYFLIWTTTPWTLPGNVAVAVNPQFIYAKIKIGNEYLILAKERIKSSGLEGELIQEFKGKDLIGIKYQPPFDLFTSKHKSEKIYEVIATDFVSLEEGTGLVHIAPAFGEDDMIVGKENDLPMILNVDEEGKFREEVKSWAGMFVKEADPLIIEDLKQKSLLFKKELYEHDYPFCWRCHSPLLYYAKESWFINMQKVKKELIGNNQKINWIPSHLKEGRFGEWLREIKDWAFSRERYWGTPLPIWKCKKCGNVESVGSLKDLLSQKFSKNSYFVLRHGESLRNQKDISACWPEKKRFPLTKKGEQEVRIVAEKLKDKKIDFIFSSDLLRTKQTAEIVGKKLGLKIKFEKRLREVNVGILNGKPIKETGKFWGKERKLSPLEYYKKRFQIAPPKGENYTDIEKRLSNFIKEMEKKYQGKNILIVSHQRPITLLEKIIYGYNFNEFVEIILGKKEIKTGELKNLEFKNLPYNENMELDFHRPYVDGVKFYCKKCENLMEKVPEVIDCWFDSGSMPFAQYHYPFENEKIIDQRIQFPADYISEAIDQTRGWFYTLLAIATLLDFGTPYKNVISLGHVLDEKGEKMSKSKGNVVNPWYILEKYGSDSTRWYFYTVNQPGDSKLFSERDVDGALKRFIMILWNCLVFYETYRKEKKTESYYKTFRKLAIKKLDTLDKWIISRLHNLISEVSNNLDNYDVVSSARSIENFVIDDFSQWYIRRSRRRFQKPESKKGFENASKTLGYVLFELSILCAPFIPFLSEEIYKNLQNKANSVHLADWPKISKKSIDEKLEKKMEKVREIVTLVLAERAKSGIKVRQPLNELQITNYELKNEKELLELIKEEVNIKKITFGRVLKLDTKITSGLKEEGTIREVIRHIQEMRKKANLKPKDKILVRYSTSSNLKKILEKNKKNILKEGKIKDFKLREKKKQLFDIEKEFEISQQKLWLGIKKI
jgi:isoleucyl-tRNA synthetase